MIDERISQVEIDQLKAEGYLDGDTAREDFDELGLPHKYQMRIITPQGENLLVWGDDGRLREAVLMKPAERDQYLTLCECGEHLAQFVLVKHKTDASGFEYSSWRKLCAFDCDEPEW